jgi:hypothetical protein
VKDPTGGVMQAVQVRMSNPVSGFSRTASTDAAGRYVFSNLPPNPYHVTVEAQGFQTLERDVEVRSGVPITLDLTLALTGATTAVEVVGHTDDLLERDPTAHTDIDETLIAKLPLETSSSGLNQIVTKSGLDQAKPTGSASFGYGSFKSPTGDLNLGAGSHTLGNFLSLSGLRTNRFLDPPEPRSAPRYRRSAVVLRPVRRPSWGDMTQDWSQVP